jgi:hypothetical protein
MARPRNHIVAVNGRELTADEIQRSGCSTIVVVPPGENLGVDFSIIRLPRAATAQGELTIVQRWNAFAYLVVAHDGETIDGKPDYVKRGGGGVRLVPLVSDDGVGDGWGTV